MVLQKSIKSGFCPNCLKESCDWGPVVKPDAKQEDELRKLISKKREEEYEQELAQEQFFDAKIPGVTPGIPAEGEDMIHHATRTGPPRAHLPSKYHIEITAIDSLTSEPRKVIVDVYAIQFALEQTPQVAHSFKKLWIAGKRSGGKSYKQDITESKVQLEMELNRIELEERLGEV